jgi:hypothetical protein
MPTLRALRDYFRFARHPTAKDRFQNGLKSGKRRETAPSLAATDSLANCHAEYFFNLLEYFVDASVSESSESAWRGGSCRGTSYGFRSRVFGSASMSGCSPRRTDLEEWAVDVDKSETEHSANEKDIACAVTSLCQPYMSRRQSDRWTQ